MHIKELKTLYICVETSPWEKEKEIELKKN